MCSQSVSAEQIHQARPIPGLLTSVGGPAVLSGTNVSCLIFLGAVGSLNIVADAQKITHPTNLLMSPAASPTDRGLDWDTWTDGIEGELF